MVPWTPSLAQMSHVTFNNRSGPHTQRKFPVSKILPMQGVRHGPAKQIHSVSYYIIIVLPPSHKRRYFSSKKYPTALPWSKRVAVLFWVSEEPIQVLP